MQKIDLRHLKSNKEYSATIGFFDGVHLGHRDLLRRLKSEAKNRNQKSLVISFKSHPRQILFPDQKISLITSNQEKVQLFEAEGIDAYIFLEFDKNMAKLTAKEFLHFIGTQLNVKTLLIGYDHRFGHNREKGFSDYVSYGNEFGIIVIEAQPYTNKDGEHISSSVIRHLLTDGMVKHALQILGRPYQLTGTVINGHKIGRKIGFPTANLSIYDSNKIIPSNGVYAVTAKIDGTIYNAMMNIGYCPTISDHTNTSLEIHILNFSGNLYEKEITIAFYQRIREEIKFKTIDDLILQLKKDKQLVETIFNTKQK